MLDNYGSALGPPEMKMSISFFFGYANAGRYVLGVFRYERAYELDHVRIVGSRNRVGGPFPTVVHADESGISASTIRGWSIALRAAEFADEIAHRKATLDQRLEDSQPRRIAQGAKILRRGRRRNGEPFGRPLRSERHYPTALAASEMDDASVHPTSTSPWGRAIPVVVELRFPVRGRRENIDAGKNVNRGGNEQSSSRARCERGIASRAAPIAPKRSPLVTR